jgi:predicted helicase
MQFDPLADRQNQSGREIFLVHSLGVDTSRDSWAYNFSRKELEKNIQFMISNYLTVLKDLRTSDKDKKNSSSFVEKLIVDNSNAQNITWDQSLKDDLARRKEVSYDPESIRISLYRPFAKKYLYYNKSLNARQYQINRIFPAADSNNLVMSINQNPSKDFGLIMTNAIPDLQLTGNGQCFPLYIYRDGKTAAASLFDDIDNDVQSNIGPKTLSKYQQQFGKGICAEDVFFYVYGLLHSRKYRAEYKTDLAKVIPRIPVSKNFHDFVIAGKRLSDLHVGYEDAPIFELDGYVKDFKDPISSLRFDKKNGKSDRTAVIVNEKLILRGVPEEVNLYSICGRSGLEWVLDRYVVKEDSNTGITQDPTLWRPGENYVINLIGRVVSVSLETVKIVEALPSIN